MLGISCAVFVIGMARVQNMKMAQAISGSASHGAFRSAQIQYISVSTLTNPVCFESQHIAGTDELQVGQNCHDNVHPHCTWFGW